MVKRNNADELVQEAIWESEHLGKVDLHPDVKGSAKRDKEKKELKSDADTAGKHIRVLITLFATNGEVRKLLKDFGVLGRDLFANAAGKASNAARPSKEELARVDDAAEKNTWIGPDGTKTGPNEHPQLNVNLPDGGRINYDPRDDPRNAQVRDDQGHTSSAGQVADAYRQEKHKVEDAAHQYAHGQSAPAGYQGSGGHSGVRDSNTPYHQTLPSAGELADGARQAEGQARSAANDAQYRAQRDGAGNAADDARQGLKERFQQAVPKEQRDKASRQYDQFASDAKELIDDEFPEERRQQFVYRLKKVLYEVQQHQDYNDAMSWLLEAAHKYEGRAERDIQSEVSHTQGARRELNSVFDKFAVVLERFANGKSLKPTRDALDRLYTDAKNDPELKQFWRDVDTYVNNVLLEPGYVMEDEAEQQGKQLEKRARSFFETGKYRDSWNALWNNFVDFTKGFHEDQLNRQFADDWKRLTKDLAYDTNGKLALKPHLWKDIRHQILPAIIHHIGYFPIPRAEYTDEKIDLVVENLILSGPNLFPNIITIENHNYFKFSPFASIKDKSHHRFRISLSQIQADIKNLRFAFRKKKGFPKMSDSGIADVVIARNGISVDIEIETIENRRDTLFKVRSVDTSIDELSFKIRDAKHDLLYKFIKVVATGAIKKAIAKGIESGIRSALEYVDDELVQIRNALDESKNDDEQTRTQAIKDLYKRKKVEAERAADSVDVKTNGGEFHIVAKKEEERLPDLGNDPKHSIVQKIDAADKKAHSGKSWHSPAFSIVPQISGSGSTRSTGGSASARATGAGVGAIGAGVGAAGVGATHAGAPQAGAAHPAATHPAAIQPGAAGAGANPAGATHAGVGATHAGVGATHAGVGATHAGVGANPAGAGHVGATGYGGNPAGAGGVGANPGYPAGAGQVGATGYGGNPAGAGQVGATGYGGNPAGAGQVGATGVGVNTVGATPAPTRGDPTYVHTADGSVAPTRPAAGAPPPGPPRV
ncbi:hypothetical protein VHUM_03034 [Vanrija humicola]|uniref:Uncharacterized protein n=1 Tax=Vanrija humicola TaxID=5417 RepID=A0A7D8Z567_VANHU|nr:hypothetical protein VHUM_03034 [Vanrija humicola]